MPRRLRTRSRLVCTWTVGALLGASAASQAQTTESPLPVSLKRIRAALAAPPPRGLAPPPSLEVPTFRVEVSQHITLDPLDDEPPPDPTWGLPSAGELLMSGIGKIGSAAAGYKKRRDTRRARKEVEEALAAFCAVHACPPAEPK